MQLAHTQTCYFRNALDAPEIPQPSSPEYGKALQELAARCGEMVGAIQTVGRQIADQKDGEFVRSNEKLWGQPVAPDGTAVPNDYQILEMLPGAANTMCRDFFNGCVGPDGPAPELEAHAAVFCKGIQSQITEPARELAGYIAAACAVDTAGGQGLGRAFVKAALDHAKLMFADYNCGNTQQTDPLKAAQQTLGVAQKRMERSAKYYDDAANLLTQITSQGLGPPQIREIAGDIETLHRRGEEALAAANDAVRTLDPNFANNVAVLTKKLTAANLALQTALSNQPVLKQNPSLAEMRAVYAKLARMNNNAGPHLRTLREVRAELLGMGVTQIDGESIQDTVETAGAQLEQINRDREVLADRITATETTEKAVARAEKEQKKHGQGDGRWAKWWF